jgi:hypothetical protein
MLNYNGCRNSSAAFTKDTKQSAQRFIQLPVRPRRGPRGQSSCCYGPASDSRYERLNHKFPS